jgi:hypothetical protein
LKQTIKKRAVIVLDLVVAKDMDVMSNLHNKIKMLTEEVQDDLQNEVVTVERSLGGVLSSERRALISNLNDIVWRGSKGKRSPIKVPKKTSNGVAITPGVKKRLQNLRINIEQKNTMKAPDATSFIQDEADFMMEHVLKYGKTAFSENALRMMQNNNQ